MDGRAALHPGQEIELTKAGAPNSLRRGWRCQRRSVVDAEAAEAGELHARMAQVEPGDQAEEIELDAFDPADLDAENSPQRRLDAGAAVGEPGIREAAKIFADSVRRQGRA